MLAVIKTGGKQYKVSEGDKIKIEKKEGDEIVFKEVLLLNDGKKTIIGQPFVEGAEVKARVLKQGRSPKVTIFKYKPKKRYKVKKATVSLLPKLR